MKFDKGNKRGKGRPPGSVNKATAKAREVIARIADDMAEEFQQWIKQVAYGVKDGDKVIMDADPEAAAKLYLAAIEYHVPKLARTTVVGDPDQPVIHEVTHILEEIDGNSAGLPTEKNS